MIKLSDYHDYRLFLKDWITTRQELDSTFTWRVAGDFFNIETAALFRICTCERHLPLKSLKHVLNCLDLNDFDQKEFQILVQLGRAKKEDLIKTLRYELLCHRSGDQNANSNDIDAQYFSFWLHPVLFSVFHTRKFKGTIEQVAIELKKLLKPKASLKEICQSIHVLLHLGLIENTSEQVWQPSSVNPQAKLGWSDGRIRNFQRECLDLAIKALETQEKESRNISTLTLHLTHQAKKQIEEEMIQFKKRVKDIVQADEGADIAMQLNIQLFSLTQENP